MRPHPTALIASRSFQECTKGHPKGRPQHATPRTPPQASVCGSPSPARSPVPGQHGRARLAPKPHLSPGLGSTGQACRSAYWGFGPQLGSLIPGSVSFGFRFFATELGPGLGPVGVPEQRRMHLAHNSLLNCSHITYKRPIYSLSQEAVGGKKQSWQSS